MHDATNVSRGSSTVNDPAPHRRRKHARRRHLDRHQLDQRQGSRSKTGAASGNKKTGTCAAFGAAARHSSTSPAITDLIGRRVRITQGDVTYVRRIVKDRRRQWRGRKRRETRRDLPGTPGKHHGHGHLRDRASISCPASTSGSAWRHGR